MSVSERIGSSKAILGGFARMSTVLALTAGLTACLEHTAEWSPAESPKVNSVELVLFEHKVNFGPVGARLSMQERERLSGFLKRIDFGYGDDAMIGIVGRKDTARDNAVASRRVETVRSQMRAMSVDPIVLPPGPDTASWDGAVRVVVTRHVISTPNCPDWLKPSERDWSNSTSSNLGCSTAVNLGLMLADPGDLVRTRRMTPGDGQRGANQVHLYRTGKVRKPTLTSPGGK